MALVATGFLGELPKLFVESVATAVSRSDEDLTSSDADLLCEACGAVGAFFMHLSHGEAQCHSAREEMLHKRQ